MNKTIHTLTVIAIMIECSAVTLARSTFSSSACGGGRKCTSPAREIAEAVMRRIAWDAYKHSNYKNMKEPRKPIGSAALDKHRSARNTRLGGSMTGWTLECEPEHFKDVDTKWRMDDTLTWLSPDGDPSKTLVEMLGNMISEAFHAHTKKVRYSRMSRSVSTVTESTEWETVKSVNSKTDFFGKKK